MKKLINGVDTVVTDALRGLAAAHPSLRVDLDNKVIFRRDARAGVRSGWSPAEGPATSRCTGVSSGTACSTRPAPGRSSPRPSPTR
ncbi:hypothetical protein [Planotetraspora sp. GP83]|uniref:hypothetical protein n=1 Tax=Planotetraspora sp. GP83 TaxID=3156264 RepID=UPI0035184527